MTMKRNDAVKQIVFKAWQDEQFKQDLIENPKVELEKELGISIPKDVAVEVLEENPGKYYLVLPQKPSELPDDMLEEISGGVGCGLAPGPGDVY